MPTTYLYFFVALLVWLSFTHAQDSLKDQAVAEIIEYLSRSESDLGDYYMYADVAIQTTPDSSKIYDYAMHYERLVFAEEKLRWLDLKRESKYPPEEARMGQFNIPCRKVHLWKNEEMFQQLSTGNWIKTTLENSRSYCYFHDIFDWPFLTETTISANHEKPRFDIDNKTCTHASRNKEGVLVAEWIRPDGKGYAKQYTGFKDGVPVMYEVVGFLGPTGDKNTDLTKGRILSKVETRWKDFSSFKLPVQISGAVASTATGDKEVIYLVDVKVDWKFGKDIPRALIDELNKIAETTK